MGITLQDIADQLQLSRSTVSRSLRNDPLVLPKTRAQVHATAVRLGYEGRPRNSRPRTANTGSEARRRPATESTQGALGLLFPAANLNQVQQDPNLVHTMHGIMAETERAGLLLVVNTMQPSERGHLAENPGQAPAVIRQGACRAVIVRGAMHPADIAFLAERLPVVSITQHYPDSPVDTVEPDNVNGVSALVRYLVELNHSSLAWVDGPYEASFLDARRAGFMEGCVRKGLGLGGLRFFGKEVHGSDGMDADVLASAVNLGTTAMVCGNDFIARQVIEALERKGVRVPQDVSVTGFDASQETVSGRRITSIDPHFSEIGRAAVRLAIQRLTQSAAPPCFLSIRSQLIPGDTVAPARR